MLLKTCPKCLGDMIVEGILGEMSSLCLMCGYRTPAEARSAGPALNQNTGSMATAQREWPYPGRQLRSDRLRLIKAT